MADDGDGFRLLTSLAYAPDDPEWKPSSWEALVSRLPPYSALRSFHARRLSDAHAAFAAVEGSWASQHPLPSWDDVQTKVKEAVEGTTNPQRVRVEVGPPPCPVRVTTAPLQTMPKVPQSVVLDDRPTRGYGDDLFLKHKTTRRRVYDDARARRRATLVPTSDGSRPFDVVLFTSAGEVAETTVANLAISRPGSASPPFITPPASTGLLPGVMRQYLLEHGLCVEGVVTVDDLRHAQQIWCFNAVRGIFLVRLDPAS